MKIYENLRLKKADAVVHNILFKKLRILKNTYEWLIIWKKIMKN